MLHKTTAQLFGTDLNFLELKDIFPDMGNSNRLSSIFSNPIIKHVIIFIFENKLGETRRRVLGLPEAITDPDEIVIIVKEIALSVGITIDRTLSVLSGGKK